MHVNVVDVIHLTIPTFSIENVIFAIIGIESKNSACSPMIHKVSSPSTKVTPHPLKLETRLSKSLSFRNVIKALHLLTFPPETGKSSSSGIASFWYPFHACRNASLTRSARVDQMVEASLDGGRCCGIGPPGGGPLIYGGGRPPICKRNGPKNHREVAKAKQNNNHREDGLLKQSFTACIAEPGCWTSSQDGRRWVGSIIRVERKASAMPATKCSRTEP
jgi:hypothetical protein